MLLLPGTAARVAHTRRTPPLASRRGGFTGRNNCPGSVVSRPARGRGAAALRPTAAARDPEAVPRRAHRHRRSTRSPPRAGGGGRVRPLPGPPGAERSRPRLAGPRGGRDRSGSEALAVPRSARARATDRPVPRKAPWASFCKTDDALGRHRAERVARRDGPHVRFDPHGPARERSTSRSRNGLGRWGSSMRVVAASLTVAASCLLAALCASSLTAHRRGKAAGGRQAGDRARDQPPARAARAGQGEVEPAPRAGRRLPLVGDARRRLLRAPVADGGPFHVRVRRYVSYRSLGENLAMVGRCGTRSARRIVRSGWTPGHRAILLVGLHASASAADRRLGGNRACLVTADFASKN